MKWRQYADSGQAGANTPNFNKPDNWSQMSQSEQAAWTAQAKQSFLNTEETWQKQALGGDYIAPGQTRSANAPPQSPDLTDDLLQKTRTSFAMRLMTGKNQRSSFGTGQMGGSMDLSSNILGGS